MAFRKRIWASIWECVTHSDHDGRESLSGFPAGLSREALRKMLFPAPGFFDEHAWFQKAYREGLMDRLYRNK